MSTIRSNLQSPPPLTRQVGLSLTIEDEEKHDDTLTDVCLKTEYKIMFISDQNLNKKIVKTFLDFNKRIVSFCDKTFINLSAEDIYSRGICMLWLNLRHKRCLEWTEKNVKNAKENDWKIILITSEKHKWVDDLKPYINEIVDLKKLQKWLVSLSFDDFINNLDEVTISKVPFRFTPFRLIKCCLSSIKEK